MFTMLRELPPPSSILGKLYWSLRWNGWKYLRRIRHYIVPREATPPFLGYAADAIRPLDKTALVEYISWPFRVERASLAKMSHSSAIQVCEMVRTLNRMGYAVDVVDWQDKTFSPSKVYDLFIGVDEGAKRLLPFLGQETYKICYATRASPRAEADALTERRKNLAVRRGATFSTPFRDVAEDWISQANATIVIGNQFTASTFVSYGQRVFTIDNTTNFKTYVNIQDKDFNVARRNFLWFGSTGLLHKGLDLVLEAFAQMKDYHLWVCGPLQAEQEKDFILEYERELFFSSNIHPIGWTSIHAPRFTLLAEKCAFTLLASCSEGMSGSILDCMSYGLIPIVNQEAGIDIDGLGIPLSSSTMESIIEAVTLAAMTPVTSCQEMAQCSLLQARTRYTLRNFRSRITEIFDDTLPWATSQK